MVRGAYGVERQGADAVGSQTWLRGSASDFMNWSRDRLEKWFPCAEPFTQSANTDFGSILHVRRDRNDAWHVALACWPLFSMRRMAPMWLVCRVLAQPFRERMMLAPIVVEMLAALRAMDQGGRGGGVWCESRAECAGASATLSDLRAAVMIDGWYGSERLDFRRAAVLRGLQVRLEGEFEADSSRPARIWAVVRMAGGPDPKWGSDQRPLLDCASGDSAPEAPPFQSRGVQDGVLAERLGVLPTIASALLARRAGSTGSLPRCVQVPVSMLPRAEVQSAELAEWVEAAWRDPVRAERELREVLAGGHDAIARHAALLARMLCASPRAAGGPSAFAAWLSEAGLAAALDPSA